MKEFFNYTYMYAGRFYNFHFSSLPPYDPHSLLRRSHLLRLLTVYKYISMMNNMIPYIEIFVLKLECNRQIRGVCAVVYRQSKKVLSQQPLFI